MKGPFKNKSWGQRGVSLVQALIAAGAIGGLGLVVTQLGQQTNKTQRTASTSYAVADMAAQIQTLLLNEGSCTATFSGVTATPDQTVPVPGGITDADGIPVYALNTPYYNGQVQIANMTLTRGTDVSTLRVTFNRLGLSSNRTNADKSDRGYGGANVDRLFEVRAQWNDTTNVLESCYSDLGGAVNTAVQNALDKGCDTAIRDEHGNEIRKTGLERGTIPAGETFAPCNVKPQIVDGTSGGSSLVCGPDEVYRGLIYDEVSKTYSPKCEAMYNIPVCQDGEVLQPGSEPGSYKCVSMKCENGFFNGWKPNGEPDCITCGGGFILTKSGNKWACKEVLCSESMSYFSGFDVNGNPICKRLVNGGDSCKFGGQLLANSNGNLEFKCCEPTCSNAANYCAGTGFTADNGCGTCFGTKPPQCDNPQNYCFDQTYASSNGCGSCTGNKPKMNATWTEPVATDEWRVQGGKEQRRYVKTCLNNQQCGGLPCSGPSDEWRDECRPKPAHWSEWSIADASWSNKFAMCASTSAVPTTKTVERTRTCVPAQCGGTPNCTGTARETKTCTYEQTSWTLHTAVGTHSIGFGDIVKNTRFEYHMIGGGGGGRGSNSGNYDRGEGGWGGTPRSGSFIFDSSNGNCSFTVGHGGSPGGLGAWGGDGGTTSISCGTTYVSTPGGRGGRNADSNSTPGFGNARPIPGYSWGSGLWTEGSRESCRNAGPNASHWGGGAAGGCSKRQQRRGGGAGRQGVIQYRFWKVRSFY